MLEDKVNDFFNLRTKKKKKTVFNLGDIIKKTHNYFQDFKRPRTLI